MQKEVVNKKDWARTLGIVFGVHIIIIISIVMIFG